MIQKLIDSNGRTVGYAGTASNGSLRGSQLGTPGLHTFRPPDPEPERPFNLALLTSSRGARRRQRAEAEAEKKRLAEQPGRWNF